MSIIIIGARTIKIEESLNFKTLLSKATLNHYINGEFSSFKWIGNNLGQLILEEDLLTVGLPKPLVEIKEDDSEALKKEKEKKLNKPGGDC